MIDKVGKAAKDLYNDALKMLEDMINKKIVKPPAVIGFGLLILMVMILLFMKMRFEKKILNKFYNLRQQVSRKNSKRANFCLIRLCSSH